MNTEVVALITFSLAGVYALGVYFNVRRMQ
jgi:hypothetical protein